MPICCGDNRSGAKYALAQALGRVPLKAQVNGTIQIASWRQNILKLVWLA
jgi:hypothetical protein